MIYYFVPYSTDGNLGEYYNNCMAIIPNGSWACFIDGDAKFTTAKFGHQLQLIIDTYGEEFKLFTCMTNRVGTRYQCVDKMWNVDSMLSHRLKGKELQETKAFEIADITDASPMSGVLMLLNKNAWFNSDRFAERGLLGVDNSIHYAIRNAGHKIGLMKGVYVEHWYRGGNINDKSHLQ